MSVKFKLFKKGKEIQGYDIFIDKVWQGSRRTKGQCELEVWWIYLKEFMEHNEELILGNGLLDKKWEELTAEQQNIYINGAEYMVEKNYVKRQDCNVLAKKIFEQQRALKHTLKKRYDIQENPL